jgi:hypothetical protein
MKLSGWFLAFIVGISSLALGQNPVPFVNQPLVPMTVAPGTADFSLTVNGTGFVSGATVNWNGTPLPTTFVNSSQLTASVPAANVKKAGTASVTVTNPASFGGASNVLFLQISKPMIPSFTSFPVSVADPNTYGGQYAGGASFFGQTTAADFNKDGVLDLFTAYSFSYPDNNVGEAALVLSGNADGSFRPPPRYVPFYWDNVITSLGGFVVADFNGDGKLDLVFSQSEPATNVQDFWISLGNGDGTFQHPVAFFYGFDFPVEFVVGDFNGDGKLDFAGVNGQYLAMFLGNGDGTFQILPMMSLGNNNLFCGGLGDYNGDGKLDLLACTPQGRVGVVAGNGDGTFKIPSTFFTVGFVPVDVAAADVNGDGKPDLIAVEGGSNGSVSILLGNGDGTFQSAVSFPVGVGPIQVVTSDFNTDSKLDLALPGTNDVYILLGNGDGTFQAPEQFPASAGSVVVGDFNQDGVPDLAMQGPAWEANNCPPYPSPCNGLDMQILLQNTPRSDFSAINLVFGLQAVNIPSSPQTITFTNGGTAALAISSIQPGGNFWQKNTCGSGLPVKGSCTMTVTFLPTDQGLRGNYLTITDNAPGSPHVLTLTGTGTDFALNPTSQTTITITAGQAANYSASVSPQFGFNQPVSLNCSGAPLHSACTVTPSSVTLDGTHSVQVNVAVVTTADSVAMAQPVTRPQARFALALMLLGGCMGFLVIPGTPRCRHKIRNQILGAILFLCLFAMTVAAPACSGGSSGTGGGGSGGGTPSGTYNLAVSGTYSSGSAKLTNNTSFTLIVQ